jgi:hypothetical protein
MKKIFILTVLLWLPFWAAAQWSVSIKAGAGMAKEFERDDDGGLSFSFSSTPGYAWFAGVYADYYFSQRLGIGSGLVYAYSRSRDDLIDDHFGFDYYWRSQALKIPVTLLWAPGASGRSLLRFGFSGEINLRHHEFDKSQSITYRDHPFFLGVHFGYEYALSQKFKIGILLNSDITYFLEQVEIGDSNGNIAVSYRRYYFTSQVTLSYRIFGKNNYHTAVK